MSKKGGASLQKDAPWRASAGKSIPKIHHSPVLRLAQTPHSNYALAVMKVILTPPFISLIIFIIFWISFLSFFKFGIFYFCSTQILQEVGQGQRPLWKRRDPNALSQARLHLLDYLVLRYFIPLGKYDFFFLNFLFNCSH